MTSILIPCPKDIENASDIWHVAEEIKKIKRNFQLNHELEKNCQQQNSHLEAILNENGSSNARMHSPVPPSPNKQLKDATFS